MPMVSRWQPTASFEKLKVRARMLQAVREYFTSNPALEVETPTLSVAAVSDVHIASVAATAIHQPRYLHTSPEYPMKRLLAAGSGDIYQICRVYRDGESGRFHNPEFTLIEWYRLQMDHHALMSDVERLIGMAMPDSREFDVAERLTYGEAMQLHAGVDAFDDPVAVLIARLTSAGIDVPASLHADRDACLDLIMSTLVTPQLGQDRITFVYDFPRSQAALARTNGRVAARFEAFLDGIELANGFHELANSKEQRARFEEDLAARKIRGLPTAPIDEHLLDALNHGLPDCAGVALGFDRLVMCATGAKHIDEVLTFPFERA